MTPSDQTELELDKILVKYREAIIEIGDQAISGNMEYVPLPDNTTFRDALRALLATAEQRARIDELNRPKSLYVDIEMSVDYKQGFDDAVEQITKGDELRIAELEQSLRKEQE